jgi:hypothetical protein
MFRFSQQRFIGTFFAPINILPATFEMCEETNAGPRAERPLLFDFNQNWNCSKIPQYQIA